MKRKDLEMVKNTTRIFELSFTKDGIYKDITGWTVYFYCKKLMTDSDINAKIKKVITSHSNPTKGITLITLDASDTANLDAGNYYFSMDWKDKDDQQGILFSGRLVIKEPIIKDRN